MRGWKAVGAVTFLVAAALMADNVYLKNGQVYTDCTARYLPDGSVEIRMRSGTVILPAEKVAYIEYEDVLEEPEEEKGAGPVLSPVLQRLFSRAKGEGKEEAGGKKKSSEIQLRVQSAVELMASEKVEERRDGETALSALGKDALRFSLPYLYDDNAYIRLGVSKVVAQMAPKEATKALVEAIYAATPERVEPPPYLTAYLLNIRNALRSATGKDFGYRPTAANQQRAVQKWVEWYNKEMLKLPPQVSEPALDREDPKYEETLKKLRKLNLEKRRLKPPSHTKLPATERTIPSATEELPPAEGILPTEEM